MKILHLSDLHVTHDGQTLQRLWARAHAAMRGELFDFVVISGDLTQRAEPVEYARLERFLEGAVHPLVAHRGGDPRARVVIVPGNHDVQWGADVFDPIPLAQLSNADELRAVIADGVYAPDLRDVRFQLGSLGHASAYRLRAAAYPSRLANVQAFFDGYYGARLAAPHRPFALLDPTGASAWSAHVFPDDEIAFAGFSSIHRNDRYWHGAEISEDAIIAARDHLDAIDPDRHLVRVAVWHHGLESQRSRPDRLTVGQLQFLLAQGFSVGLHGHVHEASTKLHDFITDEFALVATGSLGAGQTDRQDGIGNQFSIVELHRSRLTVDVFESRDLRPYERKPDRRYIYFGAPDGEAARSALRPCAGEVQRRITLDPATGIGRVEVQLERLLLTRPIVLARIDRGLCAAPDEAALAGAERLEVTEHDVGDAIEYRFAGRGEAGAQTFAKVTWSYRIANAFALDRAELGVLSNHDATHTATDEHAETWRHVVPFDHDRLVLELVVDAAPDELFLAPRGARAIVEERQPAANGPWRPVPREVARAQVAALPNRCVATFRSPRAGGRYGLEVQLAREGTAIDAAHATHLGSLVRRCRTTRIRGQSVRDTLAACIEAAVRLELDVPEGQAAFNDQIIALGDLWSSDDRVLVPCFGSFPPESWATKFRAGEGIAGHAFRFALPAAWHRSVKGVYDVIRVPDTPNHRDYEWIVGFPLLTAPSAAASAIGVLSFAGAGDHGGRAGDGLAAFAQTIARGADDDDHIDRFWSLLNSAFWAGASLAAAHEPDALTEGLREMITSCARAFGVDEDVAGTESA